MNKTFVSFLLFLTFNNVFSSIHIESISNDYLKNYYSNLNLNSTSRQIIPLLSDWKISIPESENSARINLPVKFSNSEYLIFDKGVSLTENQIKNYNIYFVTENISNNFDLKINEQAVYKNPFSIIPNRFLIPQDILTSKQMNILSLNVNSEINSKTTIPLKQSLMFPNHFKGILSGAYIELIPKTNVQIVKFKYNFEKHNLSFWLEANKTKSTQVVEIQLFSENKTLISSRVVQLSDKQKSTLQLNFPINIPVSQVFQRITLSVSILENGNKIDDFSTEKLLLDFYKKDNQLFVNGVPQKIFGVNYTPFSTQSNPKLSFKVVENDLKIAKRLGFNTIRFNNSIPTPQILDICQKLNLFVAIDIPVNMLPENYVTDEVFIERFENFSDDLLSYISKYDNVFVVNIASSLDPNSTDLLNFVENFSNKINSYGKLSSASFLDFPTSELNLDFVNVEFYSKMKAIPQDFNKNLFITAEYPVFEGSKKGHLWENSYEAQGKFFDEILTLTEKNGNAGVFFNTLVDYSGDYSSLYSSYSDRNLYKIGILGINRKVSRTSYNVIENRLNLEKRIIIPLGTANTKTPLIFILVPLFLAILMGITINLRRKFQEDTMRALLRTYNFFSDIRDQRLLLGFHSYFMFFIVAATISLLIINILFFLRANLSLERLILSFSDNSLLDFISYLAWNPISSFYIVFILVLLKLVFLILLARFFGFFNRTKVFVASIFYTSTWAFMPVTILLVLELLLLKILNLNVFNDFIYIFLVIYGFWLLFRYVKGIYVVFDVFPRTAYFITFVSITIFWGSIFLFYHLSFNTWDFLITQISNIKYF